MGKCTCNRVQHSKVTCGVPQDTIPILFLTSVHQWLTRIWFQEDEQAPFPPLHCDMCEKFFSTPAEWVRHIQSTHTEFELRVSNKTSPSPAIDRPVRLSRHQGSFHKICTVCNKNFPSHASMLIHKRTHTGEKPYMCEYCQKGFNVKSNLLRHLRTLHDRIISSTDVSLMDAGATSKTSTESDDPCGNEDEDSNK